MKYETPELTALTPAISAIESATGAKNVNGPGDSGQPNPNEHSGAYADWE